MWPLKLRPELYRRLAVGGNVACAMIACDQSLYLRDLCVALPLGNFRIEHVTAATDVWGTRQPN